jgi:MFS family permease
MLAAPPNAQIFADLSPPELRGRYQSVFYPMFPAAGFVAPAAGGWSLQQLGNWHWALCGLAGILVAAGHLLASPARERHTAARDRRNRPDHDRHNLPKVVVSNRT